ncbi:hypothetical protein IGI04_026232 [Brassica rapa subsp. trilocularis]|uniref:BZIP domain-containing protein n=1 Tax=Brassica rapa subsp. trilocularis TaxID=1813537 RepID=A0ABQ7KVE9_BRACM|nr:hypothetical protein IGI04_026232 [Brassica rapa subsp. trilocularis]
MNYKNTKGEIDKVRRTLIVASSFGDREKRRFEVLQKGISPSLVSFWPVILRRCSSSSSLLNRSLRDLVSLRDSFSSKLPKTTEARTSLITELVPHCSALTLSAIVSRKPIDSPQGDVFPCISTSENFKNVITHAEFAQPSEMKDERVDLIIDMQLNNSEDDGSYEEAAVETSDTEIEDGIEITRVSPAKKRKNRFQDTGAESRKKRLLCQRSTEKYRDLEEEMKSYIQRIQEHLQKTMYNLTQESNVDGFDPSQDKQSEEPSAFTTPMTSFGLEIFKTPFLTDSYELTVSSRGGNEVLEIFKEKYTIQNS